MESNFSIEAIYNVTTRGFIGFGNGLLCPFPEDMKRFMQITQGHVLAMGYKTWESIPNKSKFILGSDPAKIRKIAVVVNRTVDETNGTWDLSPEAAPHVAFVMEAEPADLPFDICDAFDDGEIFNDRKLIICGGARIYEKYASIVMRIHETLVVSPKIGDSSLPKNLREGFDFLPCHPAFLTSKNGLDIYRFHTFVRPYGWKMTPRLDSPIYFHPV